MHSLKKLFSLAQANIPLLLKLYEYQKQQSKQRYNVVFYLGDPALMLAIPKPKIKLTKVNDVLVSQTTDDKSLPHESEWRNNR
jgi:hypothetical protein